MDPFTAALLGSTAISAVGSIMGGRATAKAGRSALADSQARNAETQKLARQSLAPYIGAGQDAIGQLGQIYNGGQLDVKPYIDSPQYQFLQSEGENALLRQQSALGRLGSGETQRDLTQFGQGLASQGFDNYVNKLFGLAGIGQNAVGQKLNVAAGGNALLGNMGAMNAGYQADAAQSIYGGVGTAANSGIQNALFADLLKQNTGTSSFNNSALLGTPPMQGGF